MIVKQYHEVLRDLKTETRRISAVSPYKVGKSYAVVPKRGKPSIWYDPRTLEIVDDIYDFANDCYEGPGFLWKMKDIRANLLSNGLNQLRVEILAARQEPLWDIDEAGAIAEGILQYEASNRYYCPLLAAGGLNELFYTARDCYKALWESINGKYAGKRWDDNPTVWVYKFKRVVMPEQMVLVVASE